MELQLKSWYTPQGLAHALNIVRFPEDYTNKNNLRVTALRYLFENRHRDPRRCPNINELCRKSEQMFEEFVRQRDMPSANEIADIISHYAPVNRIRLLNRLREIEEERQNRIVIRNKPIKKTVYDDSQNVHNTKVNKSVLQSSQTLYDKYRHVLELEKLPYLSDDDNNKRIGRHKDDCLIQIRDEIIKKYPDKTKLIRDGFHYIKTNVGTFGIGITLQDTLLAVWLWIQEHEHKAELEKRLLEELKEMHGYCSTGHLARIVNIIQGFTEEKELLVRISENEQYNAVIRQYLNKVLSSCQDEEIIDGMTEGSDKFKNYVRNKISDILLTWIDDYGKEILEYIPDIVNDYTKIEIFTK